MIELKITGMNCQHCAQAVKDALEGVAGVAGAVKIELEPGRALVEGQADPAALLGAVKTAGYGAELVTGR